MAKNRGKVKLKLKTHRGAAKRFKITANGKILRGHSGKRHLMGTKDAQAHAPVEENDARGQG